MANATEERLTDKWTGLVLPVPDRTQAKQSESAIRNVLGVLIKSVNFEEGDLLVVATKSPESEKVFAGILTHAKKVGNEKAEMMSVQKLTTLVG